MNSPKITLPEIEMRAVCHDCRKQHTYRTPVAQLHVAFGEWTSKHEGHNVAFTQPRPVYDSRWKKWLHQFWNDCPIWAPGAFELGHSYAHNADVKGAYVAGSAYTITLASLATSSDRTAGRESTAVTNSNNYLDFLIGGKITVGTSPTSGTAIDIGAVAAYEDATPIWPDVFDGTDSTETCTSAAIKNAVVMPLRTLLVDATTSDRAYSWSPVSLSASFGAVVPPKNHVLFVGHSTGVNLNSTGGNHAIYNTGLYGTVS